MRESEKSIQYMNEFLRNDDLEKFCIEVHGIKGSLSLIGATELTPMARKLEEASRESNHIYCNENLPEFNNGLMSMGAALKKIFAEKEVQYNYPPELPPMLEKLTEAFARMDYDVIFDSIDKIGTLEFEGATKDEIESLKNAVMLSNYEFADVIIKRLLHQP
jgi:HPt (histidine-containing phosphotransfer) domain-containing protein